MRKLIPSLAWSLLLTLSARTPPAAATTLARMSLADLTRSAGAIVRVRCVAINSRDDRGMTWTFNDFDVLERFKGAPPDRIRVRVPGGRSGHLITTVEEAPRFHAGEEGVLFLETSPGGDYAITAWAEGTFRILTASEHQTGDASATVTQDSSSFAVFDPATRRFRAEGIRKLPLGEFRRKLATALAQPAPAGPR